MNINDMLAQAVYTFVSQTNCCCDRHLASNKPACVYFGFFNKLDANLSTTRTVS